MYLRNNKLRIGMISYSNLFPIFYTIQKEFDCSEYDFVEGVPSDLNRMLRNGEIDISPSSSIEYLRNPDLYNLIDDQSISADGPVGSILLFSKRPITELAGSTILTSSQSETSTAMLKIICRKFYQIRCDFISTEVPVAEALRSYSSYMLIGDDALSEALRWPGLYVYDLGEIWKKMTGLSFTYALWLERKDLINKKAELSRKFAGDLDRTKKLAMQNLSGPADASPLSKILSSGRLIEYWQSISYDFGDNQKKGLELFRMYAQELGLL